METFFQLETGFTRDEGDSHSFPVSSVLNWIAQQGETGRWVLVRKLFNFLKTQFGVFTRNFKILSSLPLLTCKHMELAIWSVQEHLVNNFLTLPQ